MVTDLNSDSLTEPLAGAMGKRLRLMIEEVDGYAQDIETNVTTIETNVTTIDTRLTTLENNSSVSSCGCETKIWTQPVA